MGYVDLKELISKYVKHKPCGYTVDLDGDSGTDIDLVVKELSRFFLSHGFRACVQCIAASNKDLELIDVQGTKTTDAGVKESHFLEMIRGRLRHSCRFSV